MQILGVSLRRPTARDLLTTVLAFAIVGAALYGAIVGTQLPVSDPTTVGAMICWGLLASLFGVDLRKGWRHWALFLSGLVAVLLVFTFAHAALTAGH
ncbi:hypothetical protein [Burkholderia contaminans]|uniref:hypothetical protein n=1 Tax=Burkholderia contaminans TaxID=488447 RepID=UPI001F12CFB2|nr:hypothetical protein [Burkholderia contaminans]UMY33550.1 hypothetical protein MMB18_38335 [Burkholderia contaminans]